MVVAILCVFQLRICAGDWENTVDFSITRHLSTRIFVHLRYDKSRPYNDTWKYWQLKEILSFGLTYRFSTAN